MAVPEHVKQPDDHKLSANEPFVYVAENGGKVTLPPFARSFTFGFMRKNRGKSELELTFDLVENICDESELEVLDSMNLEEFERFQEAWQKHSQVSMGESTAS